MDIQQVLEKYGLSNKEAALYQVCIKLGSASVYKIAKKAGLSRSTCYEILEKLKEKKLVSSFKKKSILYYSIENPNGLIEREREKIEMLETILPALRGMYMTIKNQPMARIFEGEEGMKIILKEIVSEAKEIKGFSSADDIFSILESYWPKYLQGRIENKIPAKILYTDSPQARERQRLGPQQLREVKILPPEYKPEGLIVIYNNKVATFSFGEQMIAIIVTSKELSQTQTMLFNYIWSHC